MQLEHLGRVAARALSAAIAGQRRWGTEPQPCRLVIRGSTAPLA